jgi:DNA-directed RNA polymerase specialized sigma24 family protein
MPGVAPTSAPRVRFANDGSLESVERQLHKLAIKFNARVQGMGLSMTFDDVLQEVHVSYVLARAKWNPEGGARFSTYCQTAATNNFNERIARMARERRVLGMVPTSQLLQDTDMSDSDARSHTSGLVNYEPERHPGDPEVKAHPEDSHEERQGDSPEMALQRKQERDARVRGLSKNARQLVKKLIVASERSSAPPSLRQIAADMNLDPVEMRRMKVEILSTFGVKWN